MRPIQVLLVIVILGGTALYITRLRSQLLDRLLLIAFGIAGILLALYPDVTTEIANLLGVGRGADLLLYFALLALAFLYLRVYRQQRETEQRLTELARAIALLTASSPHQPEVDSVTASSTKK
jgi:hypothetical protein